MRKEWPKYYDKWPENYEKLPENYVKWPKKDASIIFFFKLTGTTGLFEENRDIKTVIMVLSQALSQVLYGYKISLGFFKT